MRDTKAGSTQMGTPVSMACLHKTRPEKSPVWAHVRRKFVDVHASSGSSIAAQAIQRIGKTL
ncbi:hypothetical protein E1297_00550 [Roseibium sp. RKSG952]|nr:hypothetical protein [Roseibium sp. RKSG952]